MRIVSIVLVMFCGRNSVVECQLPKLDVVGSNPIARCFAILCIDSHIVAKYGLFNRLTIIFIRSLSKIAFALKCSCMLCFGALRWCFSWCFSWWSFCGFTSQVPVAGSFRAWVLPRKRSPDREQQNQIFLSHTITSCLIITYD